MTTQAQQSLRDRLLALRHRARELEEAMTAATKELDENLAEQKRVKHLLVTDVKTNAPLPTTGAQAGRRVLSQLGTFTLPLAQSRLGWKRSEVKVLVDAMECEVPPSLERLGKFEGQQMFRYTGPPIASDPETDRAEAEYESLKAWALSRTTTFTPAQAAAACDTSRAAALRALRQLQEAGSLTDRGPTQDMPLFVVTGIDVPDPGRPPTLTIVESEEPREFSKIPQIQELLAAADAAGLTVTSTDRHHAVEALDGDRVVFDVKPQGREAMLALRGRIRRMGAKL